MTECYGVTGAELLRKLRRIGRSRGVRVSLVRERGRGSHVTFYFGDRLAVIPDLKHELKTGTLHGILWPAYLTGFRGEGGEVLCPGVFSI